MKFNTCPRCEAAAVEKFEVYKVCFNCNYEATDEVSAGHIGGTDRDRDLPEYKEANDWGRAGFSIIEIKAQSLSPIFTEADYSIVRQALQGLPEMEREIVILRFWARYDVFRIADLFGLRVKTVETCLSRAYTKLKNICLECPEFSQSFIARTAAMPIAA